MLGKWATYERLVRQHLFRYSRPLAEAVLRDPDWLGDMVGAVIAADRAWDGRISLHAWRKKKLLWSLKDSVKRRNTRKARRERAVHSLQDEGDPLQDRLAVDTRNPADIVADRDLAATALACPDLKQRERAFVRLRYLEGWQLKDVAIKHGVDPRNAPRILGLALGKIRNYLGVSL